MGPGKSLTMVIPTIGCSWALSKSGGCSICGYVNDSTLDPETDPKKHFMLEWNKFREEIPKIDTVKLYNSGSFLDPKEIPIDSQMKIIKEIAKFSNIKELVVECLPEIVNKQIRILEQLIEIFDNRPIYIAIGLESSNDYINRSYINKSFYFKQYKKCIQNILKAGAFPKTYLLLKPPFLTEKEAIEDAIQSVRDSFFAGCKIVSINPVAVHADTLIDEMYKTKEYSPPWLWSVIEVLRQVDVFRPEGGIVICEIMGGGKQRGPHNCGVCDSRVLQEINYYSLHNKFSPKIDNLDCSDCKHIWKFVINSEGLLARTPPLFERSLIHSELNSL